MASSAPARAPLLPPTAPANDPEEAEETWFELSSSKDMVRLVQSMEPPDPDEDWDLQG